MGLSTQDDYRTGKTTYRQRDGITEVFCYECSTHFKSVDGSPCGFTVRNCLKCGSETSHEIPEMFSDESVGVE